MPGNDTERIRVVLANVREQLLDMGYPEVYADLGQRAVEEALDGGLNVMLRWPNTVPGAFTPKPKIPDDPFERMMMLGGGGRFYEDHDLIPKNKAVYFEPGKEVAVYQILTVFNLWRPVYAAQGKLRELGWVQIQ